MEGSGGRLQGHYGPLVILFLLLDFHFMKFISYDRKYLRDAEKKFYALTSHRYTLDAAEERINDMKSITDIEQRHKFLLLFYKIWEHGVHKLNKHVERTNKLLAEAYRVVLRKLEVSQECF